MVMNVWFGYEHDGCELINRCIIIEGLELKLMCILLRCYDVMFSHNAELWWKDFLILDPWSYDHVI